DLLTNPEVIAVNQASYDNRPHFIEDGVRVWSARVPGSKDRYLALFNTDKTARPITVRIAMLGLEGQVGVRDIWTRRNLARAGGVLVQTVPSHGAALYRITPG
ncbi:MAG: alpha-galactosidase, partial [Rhizorhabdus sp.]